MSNLITVPFHQNPISILREGDKFYVVLRPISDAFGLNWSAQTRRLKRDDVLSSTVAIMATVGADGKEREMVCIELDYLNGWLFGISANAVKPHLRDKLIEYKKECYAVLAEHFHAKPERQSENYWFRIRPHWLAIRDLVLQGKPYGEVATLLQRSVGSIRRAVKRMVEVGLINPAALAQVQIGIAKFHNLKRSVLWGAQLHLFS